jgi:hypothetical protein
MPSLAKIANDRLKAPISADLSKIIQISFNKRPKLRAHLIDATHFGGEE